jgi:hypothetical protein
VQHKVCHAFGVGAEQPQIGFRIVQDTLEVPLPSNEGRPTIPSRSGRVDPFSTTLNMDAPSPPLVSYIISLEFWGTSDVVLTVGPLIITSVNAEDGYWGSFEINWENKGWFIALF